MQASVENLATDGDDTWFGTDGNETLIGGTQAQSVIGRARELAGVFQALGTKVHLIYRGDLPLRGFDCDIRSELDLTHRVMPDGGYLLIEVPNPESILRAVIQEDAAVLGLAVTLLVLKRKDVPAGPAARAELGTGRRHHVASVHEEHSAPEARSRLAT